MMNEERRMVDISRYSITEMALACAIASNDLLGVEQNSGACMIMLKPSALT